MKTENEIVKIAVKALDLKQGREIKVLKIDSKTVLADYFVICSGSSSTQVHALADETEYQLAQNGIDVHLEGNDSNEWKILDCKDVIIHVFSKEAREFYKLDKLWADCDEIEIDDILKENEGK